MKFEGLEKKALVSAISEITGIKPIYMGMPSAAYKIGGFIVDKEGKIKSDDNLALERLLNNLKEKTDLIPSVPIENVNLNNLNKLLYNKELLIKKALGIEDIKIKVEDKQVYFHWFSKITDEESRKAYEHFISSICKLSKKLNRVNNTKKEVENEKYAFRCFLLRLGFIGDEYKSYRKTLTKNLSGSSSFKNAKKC